MSGIVGAATTTGVIVSVSDDGKSDFIEVKQEDLSAAPVGGGSSTNQGVVGNSGAAEDQEEEAWPLKREDSRPTRTTGGNTDEE